MSSHGSGSNIFMGGGLWIFFYPMLSFFLSFSPLPAYRGRASSVVPDMHARASSFPITVVVRVLSGQRFVDKRGFC